LPAIPGGWGTYATLVAFGAAVSITGYFATDQQEEAANRERGSQAARTVSVAEAGDARGARGARAQPPISSSAVAEGSPGDEAIAQIEWTLPQASPGHYQGTPAGRRVPRDTRSTGNESPRPIETGNPDSEPSLAPMVAAESVAASRAAPAPETQATPTSDRRQVMAAALLRCERENFLAGFVCKERAWLQFCDGQWGEEPQCPTGGRSNNAR
jgi:hypothetical protein